MLNEEDTGGLLPNYSLEVYYDDVQVTGGAMNWWESHLDVVVRAEVAWFWEESVFIPEVNAPLVPTGLPIPGLEALPTQGAKTEKDILQVDDRVRQERVDPEAEQDADLLRVHAVLRPVHRQLRPSDQAAGDDLPGARTSMRA